MRFNQDKDHNDQWFLRPSNKHTSYFLETEVGTHACPYMHCAPSMPDTQANDAPHATNSCRTACPWCQSCQSHRCHLLWPMPPKRPMQLMQTIPSSHSYATQSAIPTMLAPLEQELAHMQINASYAIRSTHHMPELPGHPCSNPDTRLEKTKLKLLLRDRSWHTCIHIRTYTLMYIYVYTYIHIRTHSYTHTYIYVDVYIYIHINIYIYICSVHISIYGRHICIMFASLTCLAACKIWIWYLGVRLRSVYALTEYKHGWSLFHTYLWLVFKSRRCVPKCVDYSPCKWRIKLILVQNAWTIAHATDEKSRFWSKMRAL